MAIALNPQSITMLALIPLIVWRLYSRIKRLIGRQQSKPLRHWINVTLFPLVLLAMGFVALGKPLALVTLLGGVAGGMGLAVYGLRLTRFEKTNEGMFYTPNAHIGIGLTLLFAARMLYRMVEVFSTPLAQRANGADFTNSPLTMLILGLVFGYYTLYAAGILRWRSGKLKPANDAAY